MTQTIDQTIARLFGPHNVTDSLAEISRDLFILNDRLSFVLESRAWTPSLNIHVPYATFESLPGPIVDQRDYTIPFLTKHVAPGITVFTYDMPPIDHDLTAENAPGEWAMVEPKNAPDGLNVHCFNDPSIDNRSTYEWSTDFTNYRITRWVFGS